MTRGWKWLLSAVALGVAALIGCGDDPVEPPAEELFAPEAWAGVWDITVTERECGDDSVLAVSFLPDSLCTGESLVEFLLGEEQGELSCTGSWTDTDLVATCVGSSEVLGCHTDVFASITAVMTDSGFDGTVRLDVQFDCEEDLPDDCLDVDLDATRRAPKPASCPEAGGGALSSSLNRQR